MSYIIIVTGSVTSAVRLEKYLRGRGITAATGIHTPAAVGKGGCSHSVRVPAGYHELIKKLIKSGDIHPKAIFSETKKEGERIYRDIS